MITSAHYRVSSRSHFVGNLKVFVGRVHFYEPFVIQWPGERRDSVYKRALYSESTGIERLTAKDAQDDAIRIGREATGKQPDN